LTDSTKVKRSQEESVDINNKYLLSVPEAADMLSIGRSRCYELVLGGELASLKLGRRRLIPREALQAFVAKRLEEVSAQDVG